MKAKQWNDYTDMMHTELSVLSGRIREGVADIQLEIERWQAERRLVRIILSIIVLLLLLMLVFIFWARWW